MALNPESFWLFSSFSQFIDNIGINYAVNGKILDRVIGIQTRAAGVSAQTNPQSLGRPQQGP